MRNRNVGFLIIGISALIVVIIWLFNRAMKKIVSESCSHGPNCAMYGVITTQTQISVVIAGFIFLIGLFLVFSKEKEKIVVKKIKEAKNKINTKDLNEQEKEVINILMKEGGAIFQASLMEKLSVGKVKITRLLDKLEAKQLIERKRRGMNNIVILRR